MIYSLCKISLIPHSPLPFLFSYVRLSYTPPLRVSLILLTFFLLFAKILAYGAIAQLIRALPLQGRGPGFESLLLHHFSDKISHGVFSVPPLDTPPTKDPKGLFSYPYLCFYIPFNKKPLLLAAQTNIFSGGGDMWT